jgi:murein DD-endopeptidase MepM/ murein hydrolase activator NlpD
MGKGTTVLDEVVIGGGSGVNWDTDAISSGGINDFSTMSQAAWETTYSFASMQFEQYKEYRTPNSKKFINPLNDMQLRGNYRSGWYPNLSEYGGRNGNHQGLDLYASPGTSTYAVIDGTIVDKYFSSTYGNTVTLKGEYDGKIYYFFYAHLQESVHYRLNDSLKIGDLIGNTGQTGNARNQPLNYAHLHFELRSRNTRIGNRINPNIIKHLTYDSSPNRSNQR